MSIEKFAIIRATTIRTRAYGPSLPSDLVSRMFALVLAELHEFPFRRAFSHTDIRAIVPITALFALKPDIFPFAFLFSHKNSPNRAQQPDRRKSVLLVQTTHRR